MSKHYCHNCSKEVGLGEVLCENCYKNSKFHLLFNILGFLFGLTAPLYAIIAIVGLRNTKHEFFRWTAIGLIIPVATGILGLLNHFLEFL
ncbi:MAG: hypothetical protein IJI58_03140 [Bacilli bacterium]|nr:hypothetical protein [Bacilli bacterium]